MTPPAVGRPNRVGRTPGRYRRGNFCTRHRPAEHAPDEPIPRGRRRIALTAGRAMARMAAGTDRPDRDLNLVALRAE
jgi:hypothetical protein